MRKSLMLSLLALLGCMGASAHDTVAVSTLSGFKTAVKNNSYIKLTADIDISGMGMNDITFKGTVDGMEVKGGDTIYHALAGGTKTARASQPMFNALDGATFKNLVIRNFRIEWDDDDIGAVACTAKNSTFENIAISDISIFNDDDNAGAIAGSSNGCTFRNVKGLNNDITVDGDHAGGFVGDSYNSVYCDCSSSAMSTVYADGSWGNAYAGGFTGESSSDQFVFCYNFGCVGALDDRVGGFTGYSSNSHFTNCTNSGYIMHCEEKDFISSTNSLKAALGKYIDEHFDDVMADLGRIYDKQNFDLKAAMFSFFGTVGGLVTLTTIGLVVPVFMTVAAIVVVTGVVVTLIDLINAEIGAHDEIGGICGACQGSVFDSCSNYGTVMCRDSYAGGIVGLLRNLPTENRISNCLNAGRIIGYDMIGGIFGESNRIDIITKCLNVGKIEVEDDGNSDPIGSCINGSNITYNYYLSGYYDNNARARIPVTEDMLASGTVTVWLNGGDGGYGAPWRQDSLDRYPVLDPAHTNANPKNFDNVYVISSVEDLDGLRTAVNNGARYSYVVYIVEDIDCADTVWVPIGSFGHPFSGICYGNGHTISNLNTDGGRNGVGFFGVVDINTEVRDLFIGSGNIKGGNGVGAIIGYAEHRTDVEGYIRITGCGNAATVSGSYDCGGIIGAVYSDKNMKLTLDNCYNMGTVNADSLSAALCGFAKKGALVTSCWNSGSVTGYRKGMGFVRGDADAAPVFRNCYNAAGLSDLITKDDIYSFTPDEVMNGTLCVGLNGRSNDTSVGLNWEQNIGAEGDSVPHYSGYNGDGKGVYASRTVSSQYGTVVLPFTVRSDSLVRFYTLTDVRGSADTQLQLHFSAVDSLLAGTPAVFRVVRDSTYEFVSISDEFSYALNPITVNGWTMTGNLNADGTDEEFTGEILNRMFFISGDKIRSASQKVTMLPFRAYILGPSGTAPRGLTAFFNDMNVVTSIPFIPAEIQKGTGTDGIYNIAGQRLSSPQPGFNIIGGSLFYLFDE
ncbi:MAG: hypothetical protein MJY58_04335 [Bacteroidaceae bacterium]|nr:hypothetical protein [Bacteroidaceae bacterium]